MNKPSTTIFLGVSMLAFSQACWGASIILSEYNAVGSLNWLGNPSSATVGCPTPTGPGGAACATDYDTFFGRVQGNGGNWFELVVITDHLDMRNWQLFWEEIGNGKVGTIFLSGNAFWADLRAGTIITFTESTTAQGGLSSDVSFDPCHGDWWVNVNTFDTAYVTTTTTNVVGDGPGNFSVGDDYWRVTIRNSVGTVMYGPAGEGSPLYTGTGVSSTEICRLKADPSGVITPASAYDDGKSSTFGSANTWKDAVTLCRLDQNFSALRLAIASGCHICQRVILNDYNAVADGMYLNGGTLGADLSGGQAADAFFGRTLGNGGNWLELVAIQDHLDMRGWRLFWEELSPPQSGTITLSANPFWSDVRSGMIITFIEHTSAQGGLNTDVSYNPAGGDRWVNINTFDTAYVAGTTSTIAGHVSGQFSVSENDWRLTVKDAANVAVFGPAGEGSIYYSRDQVSNINICRLEQDPSSSITMISAYDDGASSSTFGAPNHWTLCPSTTVVYQSFSALPDTSCERAGDVNGDGVVNINDLLAVINAWGPCGGGPCPADVAPSGGDGVVNVNDLLMVINNWG